MSTLSILAKDGRIEQWDDMPTVRYDLFTNSIFA